MASSTVHRNLRRNVCARHPCNFVNGAFEARRGLIYINHEHCRGRRLIHSTSYTAAPRDFPIGVNEFRSEVWTLVGRPYSTRARSSAIRILAMASPRLYILQSARAGRAPARMCFRWALEMAGQVWREAVWALAGACYTWFPSRFTARPGSGPPVYLVPGSASRLEAPPV